MDKSVRAEVIAALVTDKYSGFKDGDEGLLEACSDTRLEEFRSASETRKAEAGVRGKLETENRNITARLKVAEDRVKSSESELSEDDFIARAPQVYKTIIEEHRAAETAMRASLVSQLKDCGTLGEDELKKKTLDELKTLASYARVTIPDFTGRGVAVERHASQNDRNNYAPPDPYKMGLDKLRTASKQ